MLITKYNEYNGFKFSSLKNTYIKKTQKEINTVFFQQHYSHYALKYTK